MDLEKLVDKYLDEQRMVEDFNLLGSIFTDSDLFVWIFLAFAALIVVAQLLPAIMMVVGLVKSRVIGVLHPKLLKHKEINR